MDIIAEGIDNFTVPLNDALSLLVSSESDDSRRGGGVSPGFPSPNGEARGNSIAHLCRQLTSSGWSFGGRATGHYRQGSRKPWPCGAHASCPPMPGPAPWHLGARGRDTPRPSRPDLADVSRHQPVLQWGCGGAREARCPGENIYPGHGVTGRYRRWIPLCVLSLE